MNNETPTNMQEDLIASINFMQNLQTVDLENIDADLEKISIEAANIFPMISDAYEVDGEGGNKVAAFREKLLDDSIVAVTQKDRMFPFLTLEQPILINHDGHIIDGRNRVRAILKRGLPKIDYTGTNDEIVARWQAAVTAKAAAIDSLKAAAGIDGAETAYSDADLLFRATKRHRGDDKAAFDAIMNRNLARRDLNTSQRACVAANISLAKLKGYTGLKGKVTDSDIADQFGIGHKTMKRAKALKTSKGNRDLFNDVLHGRLSVAAAEKIAKDRAQPVTDDEAVTPKAKKKADPKADVETKVVYKATAIREGIANTDLTDAAVIDAIVAGLKARMKPETDDLLNEIRAIFDEMTGE